MKSKIVEFCESLGITAVKASFGNLAEEPHIKLDEADFLLAIKYEDPKVVYFYEESFDPADFVEIEVENSDLEVEFDDDGKIQCASLPGFMEEASQVLAPLSSMTGSAYFLVAIFSDGGPYRMHSCHAAWFKELSSKLQVVISRYLIAQRLDIESEERTAQAAVHEIIDEIAANEDFRKIRGLPKRLLWVQAKYASKIPSHPQGRVGRVAQNTELVDANLAFVVTKAHEKTWIESNLNG